MALALCRSRLPALLVLAALSPLASAQQAIGWGYNARPIYQLIVPASAQSDVVAISSGYRNSLALKSDGTVVAWGSSINGLANVPAAAQSGVVAVSAGFGQCMVLKSDGRVFAWGYNVDGQTNVPAAAQDGGAVAIAASNDLFAVLKSDGTLVFWSTDPIRPVYKVPDAAKSGVVAVATGRDHCLVLKSDGSVFGWGDNSAGQINVPDAAKSGVVAIAAGFRHSIALKSDGSVVAWGSSYSGLRNVPAAAKSGVVAIAAGSYHNLALKNDGSVVAWGENDHGQINVPASAGSGIAAITAGDDYSFALRQRAYVSLAPSTVWGGDASLGKVKLVGPAKTGGVTVPLASGDAGVHVPTSVTVPAGATSATFPITVDPFFGADRTATVTSTYDGASSSASLSVKGNAVSAAFDHPDLTGGSTTGLMLKVSLGSPLASDATFDLASTGPLSGMPATVTVAAGVTEVKIPLTTARVVSTETASVVVSYGGSAVGTAFLAVKPFSGSVVFSADRVDSGQSVRGTVYLKAATLAPVEVGLSSSDPSVTVPLSVTVPAGERTASFAIDTYARLRTADVPITAMVGDVAFTRDLRVSAATSVKSVTGPGAVYGGASATFIVTLSRPAGVGGYAVALSASGISHVPGVTVPEGATSATFDVVADDVDAITPASVTATGSVNSVSMTSSVRPNVVTEFSLSSNTVASGGSVIGTVTLKAAVAVDTVVQLSSGDPLVTVQGTVTIPAGSRTGTFTATAGTAAKSKNVTITATKNGVSLSKGVKVLPL